MSTPQLTPEELASTPAQPPPPGVTPNFIDPETSAPQWTAGILVALIVMLIILTARLYGKAVVVKKLGFDDIAILLGGIITTAMGGVSILIFWRPGFATHTWDVPLITYFDPNYTARILVVEIIAPWSSYFTKLSILLFLLTLFPRTARPVTAYLLYIGIAVNTLFYVIITFYTGIMCIPRYGDNGMSPPQCSSEVLLQVGEAVAGINMTLDLYTLGISIYTVLLLQMSARRKIGVILIFCTGMLACICSILTLAYRVEEPGLGDPAWNSCAPIALGTFESCAGVIAACLPCMPVVWHHISPRMMLSWRRLLTLASPNRSHATSNYSNIRHPNGTSLEHVVGDGSAKVSTGDEEPTQGTLDEHELTYLGKTNTQSSVSKYGTKRNAYEV